MLVNAKLRGSAVQSFAQTSYHSDVKWAVIQRLHISDEHHQKKKHQLQKKLMPASLKGDIAEQMGKLLAGGL